MRKVLIISYYWPPSGGSGVQRWLKLSNYLPENGWLPTVYTPSNPEFPSVDESLQREISDETDVVTQPIWEPYKWYKRITGKSETAKVGAGFANEDSRQEPGFAEQVSVWLRGNFFIPDARVFWVKPSVRFLQDYLRDHPVDAIISTGPPHSVHLIAKKIAQLQNIPWIADFRDPWTNVYYFNDLKLTKWAEKKHLKLEKEVCDTADVVSVVTPRMKTEFQSITKSPVEVVLNGFDQADFDHHEAVHQNGFRLWYAGTLMPSQMVPEFWSVIKELVDSGIDIHIDLAGKIDGGTMNLISEIGLSSRVHLHGYLPHQELIGRLKGADALLLILPKKEQAEHILTGKVFDYIGAQKPIIGLGINPSDAGNLLQSSGTGKMFSWDDSSGIKNFLLEILNEEWTVKDSENQKFTRQYQAKEFADILNNLANKV